MSAELFKAFANSTGASLKKIREITLDPNDRKTLRYFYTNEVCKLLDTNRNVLHRLVDTGRIPKGAKDSRNWRYWTLQEVRQIAEHLEKVPHRPEDEPLSVIAVSNFKGGAAKTTTSVNLAQHLARSGLNVVLIDLDPQGSATSLMGFLPNQPPEVEGDPDDLIVNGEDTVWPYMLGESDSILPNVRETYWPGLRMIPASLELHNVEMQLPMRRAKDPGFAFWAVLQQGLKDLKPTTDVVVLDCPPSLGFMTMNALWAATGVIIPIPPEVLDLSSAYCFFDMAGDVLDRLNSEEMQKLDGRVVAKNYDFVRILVTRYGSQQSDEDITHILKSTFGEYIFENYVLRTAIISGAQNQTPLEIGQYDGSTKTYKRAMANQEAVNGEIQDLICSTWNTSATKRRRAS